MEKRKYYYHHHYHEIIPYPKKIDKIF